jgi:hypothetical protein
VIPPIRADVQAAVTPGTQLRRAVRMMRAQIERLIADQNTNADNR